MCLQVAEEGGCDSEGMSCSPEPQALVLVSHPRALLARELWGKVFKLTALAFPYGVPTLTLGKALDSPSLSFLICEMELAAQHTVPFLKPVGSDTL